MNNLYLNDIFHLTDEEIKNTKVTLSMKYEGKTFLSEWYESDENNRNVDFSYASHKGSTDTKNFDHIGQWCFGFVRLENPDLWLLISAGEITELVDHGHCPHREIDQFKPFIGRLVVKYHNRGQSYSRKLENLMKEMIVLEILPNIYEPLQWKGHQNVHLTFRQLSYILNGIKYTGYREALKVKGIYCLTDTKTGLLYIGSAYGKDGVSQRWDNYLNTQTGGNIALISLYNKEGEEYFKENFEFTLLEHFGSHATENEIIERESYWKKCLATRKHGYNEN